MESEDDGFGLVVFGVACDDVLAVRKEGGVACFSCCVFCSFAVFVNVDFVDCGRDVVVSKKCFGGLCYVMRVFLKLVVDDHSEEIVVFVFHGVCECE